MPERLQKALASAGIGSRRACEKWIEEGRVRVNGQVVTELGTKVDLATDRVTFDGRPVRPPRKHYYLALNKPRGVVTTLADPHAARVVTDLVDIQGKPLLRPVGRLDADSEGLLLLTDDGDFLYKLTHPKHHVPKVYRATVQGIPDAAALERLSKGVMLEDGMTAPADTVHVRKFTHQGDGAGRADVELTLYEGRNRQVRRMLSAVGHPVIRLVRIRIGPVSLAALPSGAWRHLTQRERAALTSAEAPTEHRSQEKHAWQTAPQPSKPPKAPSSPSSPKLTRPSRPRTSSNLRKRGSTTA